jgi:hypothetical protein
VNYDVPKPNRLADAALEAARNGDWRLLDDYIDRGFPMTDALRQYFRSLLPRAPHPKHRAKTAATQMLSLEIAAFVWRAKRDGAHDPIARAERHFKKSRRKVQTDCNAFGKLDAEAQDFVLQALAGKKPKLPALRPLDDAAPIEGRRATTRRLKLGRK